MRYDSAAAGMDQQPSRANHAGTARAGSPAEGPKAVNSSPGLCFEVHVFCICLDCDGCCFNNSTSQSGGVLSVGLTLSIYMLS